MAFFELAINEALILCIFGTQKAFSTRRALSIFQEEIGYAAYVGSRGMVVEYDTLASLYSLNLTSKGV